MCKLKTAAPTACSRGGGIGHGTTAILVAGVLAGSLLIYSEPVSGAHTQQSATVYALTELGTLGGTGAAGVTGGSEGAALNDAGQVTGWALTSAGQQHAFLWNGTAMMDLGTFGGPTSVGVAINASGQVTGYADLADVYYAGSLVHQAFLWDGSFLHNLGSLTNDTPSSGVAINALGQVTGRTHVLIGGVALAQSAFVWTGTEMRDLGSLDGGPIVVGPSDASDISDAGQVTGTAYSNLADEWHAYLWNGTVMQDLGTLGGTQSLGMAINNSGQVTGWAQTSGGVNHAFLWNGSMMQDLGTLGGSASSGIALNALGQVTGSAAMASETPDAFLWDGTAMVALGAGAHGQGNAINDSGQSTGRAYSPALGWYAFVSNGTAAQNLNTLIDLTDPLQPYVRLHDGRDINVSGQIVANGIDSRTLVSHAYLLTPITDSDGDGINDSADNCILIANADQRDTNGDGYGNSCDPDLNNDGTVNFSDIAIWVPYFNTINSGDADFNGDGVVNFVDFSLFPAFFLHAPGPSGATL